MLKVLPLAEAAATHAEEIASRRRHLASCVEGLEGAARQVVRLRYSKALSISEVAAHTKRSVGSVTMRLARIRKALRTCVDRRLRESTQGVVA